MSGICGVVFPDVYQAAPVLTPLLNALIPRGENRSQEHSYKNISVGCCGSPLASNRKKTLWCLLDGQLFHTDTLRKKLESAGRSVSNNPTSEELILTAFELWNHEFLREIEGDFAIAILDQEKDELILARDRVGRKPLYWYHNQRAFIFASELKAIMASGLVPQTPSESAIASYLFFGFIPQDNTPIANITRLLPGHYLKFHLNHKKSIQSYWAYSSYFNTEDTISTDDAEKKLEQLLIRNLRERLPTSEENCSCFISGGLGSASIAYYLKQIKKTTKGFSCAFQEQTEADLDTARTISKALQIEHSTSTIGPTTLLENLPAIVWHLDEPLADPNIAITWRLAKEAANYGPYTFSGMGSDEVLAGHARFKATEKQPSLTTITQEMLKPIFKSLFLKPLLWLWPRQGYQFLRHYPTNPMQANYLNENALLNISTAKKAAPLIANHFDLDIFLHRFYNISRIGTNMDAMLYLDVKTRLVDLYIHQYDRLTACHKLRWRSPYLSREILEFAAILPRGGLSRDTDESLLTTILREDLPKSVIDRKKVNRPNLLKEWIDYPEIIEVFSLLPKGSLIRSGMISKEWVHSLLNKAGSHKNNAFLQLWSILCLEIWYRLYIDQPIRTSPPEMNTIDFLRGQK